MRKIKNQSSWFVLLILFFIAGKAQAQSPVFRTYVPLYDSCSKTLNLRIESSSFFKNNEYFDKFAYGYTGLGFYVKPTLEYYFTPKIKVSAGVYLLKYSGRNNFTQVIPIFSVQYKMAKSLELVMGNIYGTANHQLAEPLFRYDRYFQNHVEYGFQFLLNTAKIHSDLWLSWEHYIMVGDTAQEHLMVGSSSVFRIMHDRHGFSLSIPLQFLVAHRGGQLAPSPHKPISSIFNGLTGLKLAYRFSEKSRITFEPQFLLYKGLNLPSQGEANAQPFKNGWGSYTTFTYQYSRLHVMAGYWYAERFISPHGEYLFQSVSEIDPDFSQAKRELLTTKVWINKTIYHSIKLEARFESYYDLMTHNLDYSYGLYIVMNESFFLTKYKR